MNWEYIRGLVEGEGCFTFSRSGGHKIPAFAIGMHERDEKLLNIVRDRLKLKNKVYNFREHRKDGHKRGRKAFLIVRDISQLKNKIVPFFYGRLWGHKGIQFLRWLENIGGDPNVPKTYKIIHELHVSGFYEKNRWLDDPSTRSP